jgi:TonB family protein
MSIDLRQYLYWSLGCHFLGILLLFLSPFFPFQRPFTKRDQITWVHLSKGAGPITTRAAIQKALDLPKTTIEEQKKKTPEPLEQKRSKKMKYEEKGYSKKGRKRPAEKTEEEKRIDEILKQARQEVAMRAKVPEAAQIPTAPSGGVPDGSTQGPLMPGQDSELDLYRRQVRDMIIEQWIPPLNLRDPSLGLICKILVRINERGEVLETQWDSKSGHEAFDLSALRAIKKAAPLKPPPEKLKREAIHEGIVLEFNPALLGASTR